MDERWHQLAEILVNYSTEVRPGQRVLIAMGETATESLVRGVYEAATQVGAYVQVQFLSESLRHALLRCGTPDQISWVPELEAYGLHWADVYLGLRGAYQLDEHADIPADRLALNQQALGKISALRWEQTRWCLTRVPNQHLAQQAETDLDTLLDMYFSACLLDWPAETAAWEAIARRLEAGSELRVVGRGTDLRFRIAGRKWCVGNGKLNMPDGEIFTAPVTATVNGQIAFEFPGVLGGRLVHDLRLAWHDGQLTTAEASTHQDYLHAILALDPGAQRIGEFGFGVNPCINRFCKDILLDEKLGGTVHIALGRAYPECGGDNQSAIHWDLVKDLRREGAVYVDGRQVFAGGQFAFY
jgi:aminopeptidase